MRKLPAEDPVARCVHMHVYLANADRCLLWSKSAAVLWQRGKAFERVFVGVKWRIANLADPKISIFK